VRRAFAYAQVLITSNRSFSSLDLPAPQTAPVRNKFAALLASCNTDSFTNSPSTWTVPPTAHSTGASRRPGSGTQFGQVRTDSLVLGIPTHTSLQLGFGAASHTVIESAAPLPRLGPTFPPQARSERETPATKTSAASTANAFGLPRTTRVPVGVGPRPAAVPVS
jgi:hypothetical protein